MRRSNLVLPPQNGSSASPRNLKLATGGHAPGVTLPTLQSALKIIRDTLSVVVGEGDLKLEGSDVCCETDIPLARFYGLAGEGFKPLAPTPAPAPHAQDPVSVNDDGDQIFFNVVARGVKSADFNCRLAVWLECDGEVGCVLVLAWSAFCYLALRQLQRSRDQNCRWQARLRCGL